MAYSSSLSRSRTLEVPLRCAATAQHQCRSAAANSGSARRLSAVASCGTATLRTLRRMSCVARVSKLYGAVDDYRVGLRVS